MQSIQLQRKKIKKFILNDKELILTIDTTTINHFQKTHKKGFLKLLNELQDSANDGDLPIYEMIQLLGSCTHKLSGQPVGVKFFDEYDPFDIVNVLAPQLFELFSGNLPKPKDDTEKK